jgi:hypothetical protein
MQDINQLIMSDFVIEHYMNCLIEGSSPDPSATSGYERNILRMCYDRALNQLHFNDHQPRRAMTQRDVVALSALQDPESELSILPKEILLHILHMIPSDRSFDEFSPENTTATPDKEHSRKAAGLSMHKIGKACAHATQRLRNSWR